MISDRVYISNFRNKVLDAAKRAGWRAVSIRATDDDGFPRGILLTRGDSLFFVVLSNNDDNLTGDEIQWMSSILASRTNCEVWTPEDWDRIGQVLREGKVAA